MPLTNAAEMTNEHDRQLCCDRPRGDRAHTSSGMAAITSSSPRADILARPGGAFVTLHKRRRSARLHRPHRADRAARPRRAAMRRRRVQQRSAVSADHAEELDAIAIEISLLGPLEPIAGPQDIDVGRHGLVVERGWQRGLLLPQVATEWRWDAETFLAQTCQKAGLPKDAWKNGAKVWRFEAEVFVRAADRYVSVLHVLSSPSSRAGCSDSARPADRP